MKILFFYEGLAPGGVERMAANLSFELIAQGHSLTFLFAGSPTENDYKVHPETKIVWLKKDKSSARAAFFDLLRHLWRWSPDVLLTAMPQYNILGTIAKLFIPSNMVNIATERNDPEAEYRNAYSWRYRLVFKMYRYIYPRADAVVCVSDGLKHTLAKFARLDVRKLKTIHNPAYRSTADETIEHFASHPWLDDRETPVIVAAGRLVVQKDFPTFLKAMAITNRESSVRAIILGDGPLRAEIEGLIRQLGLEHAVAMVGHVDDVRPYIRKSGFFVLSSGWEGFGNVLVEALGVGASIVSTDCPSGPREILEDGKFGILVPVGDHIAMANAILRLTRSPFDSKIQQKRALDFSTERIAKQYETLFLECMRRRESAAKR